MFHTEEYVHNDSMDKINNYKLTLLSKKLCDSVFHDEGVLPGMDMLRILHSVTILTHLGYLIFMIWIRGKIYRIF